jgi:hypothetical protein
MPLLGIILLSEAMPFIGGIIMPYFSAGSLRAYMVAR